MKMVIKKVRKEFWERMVLFSGKNEWILDRKKNMKECFFFKSF